MDLSSRYEILDTIASGDFATVLRARDRELGREVAIKQIHQQFLADPQQLARYWREAQLLASLQHPNILTIYDIVRPRGWLILELMQGSLKQRAEGEPLELDSLRTVLAAGLGALQFLHSNGVIHGDIKPGNLLFDAQNRVKLGDFGLARRATSEQGSLLKGTTKYMAPELVSEQFGTVGPASDLYSLGFAAYELMCGSQFESLFPGLGTLGRDSQIAWMMWHAAADRRLPEIGRVLEGVPEDLAGVIQRLATKDQDKRYRSAEDALRDLSGGRAIGERMAQDEGVEAAALAATARKKRRLRLVAVFAVALSLTLSAAMLLKHEKPVASADRGVITEVDATGRQLALISSEDQRVRNVSFTRYDRFFVNDEPAGLEDLRPEDQVVVRRVQDEKLGRWITEVRATRPIINSGRIKEIAQPGGAPPPGLTLTIEGVDGGDGELVVWVPQRLAIVFNGDDQQPVGVGDLETGDRVVVEHLADGQIRKAIKLSAQRVVENTGIVCQAVDDDEDLLRVELGEGDARTVLALPLADDCTVTINGQPSKAPTDLRQGDRVEFQHDTQVVSVTAYRVLRDRGRVERVAPGIAPDRLRLVLDDGGRTVVCLVTPECSVTLFGEPAALSDLHRGDTVEITHDSLDRSQPRPTEIAALRPADPTRWAIIVGIQDYADPALTPLEHPRADATLLRDTLVKRYWVPEDQALLLTDEGRMLLQTRIRQQLGRIGPDGKLLVYFAGHAYRNGEGNVYIAPADFQLSRTPATGLPLQWLLDELETCRAGQKLLLLDCCQAGEGADLQDQPSTAEMIASLRGPPGWAALRTVTAVASCSSGQRGQVRDDEHGLFAWSLSRAYDGGADQALDQQVDPAELFAFLQRAMAPADGQAELAQTPVLFLPDNRPPRLDEDAKREILRLAEHVQREKLDLDAADAQYAVAARSAAGQPEPELSYGLLLLRDRQREAARRHLSGLKYEHPDWLIPSQGIAWTWFEERGYSAGLGELRELALRIPRPTADGQELPQQIAELLTWVGRLRRFAEIAAERGSRLPVQSLADLDAAVAALGTAAHDAYDQGQQQATRRREEIEGEAERERQAGNLAAASQLLAVDQYRLDSYAAFPFDEVLKQIEGNLDRREPQY